MNELLKWNATADALPDADITVLMWVKYPDDGISREQDWASGWWDGEVWRDAGSAMIVIGQVTHWAEPNGPADCRCNGCEVERLREALHDEIRLRQVAADEIERLRAFALGCLDTWPDVGLDGVDLQELALKTGLLEPHTVTAPCGENCNCIEYHGVDGFAGGVICYRKTALLRGA